MNDQFSLVQLIMAILSSSVVSSSVTSLFSRRQNVATVDATVRNTLGEVIADLRNQIDFLNKQILSALSREKEYMVLMTDTTKENNSLRAELTASQLSIRHLEGLKQKYELKLANYETIKKRAEAH